VRLIAFIIGVPIAVMVMFVRCPLPSVFCVTVDPVMGVRLFTLVVACVMCPPGGSVLTVKAKLMECPRASRRTIWVVEGPPEVPAAVTVLVPVVWAVVDCLILRIPITNIKIKVLMRCMRCSFPVNGHS
jgi:hypothetical protein